MALMSKSILMIEMSYTRLKMRLEQDYLRVMMELRKRIEDPLHIGIEITLMDILKERDFDRDLKSFLKKSPKWFISELKLYYNNENQIEEEDSFF